MRNAAERRLAIGVFDGVHIGHQAILKGADAAVTFSRHPLSVIDPSAAPHLIMSLDERVARIRDCGVGDVTVIDFDESTAMMPAEDFAGKYLGLGSQEPVVVRCGGNWRFGRGGEASASWLRERGVKVEVVRYAEYGGLPVSSSRIRRNLEEGDMESVNAMLGRPYAVSATPVRGKGAGRKLGFPTVNFNVDIRLRRGVYEVEMGGFKGIANYGLAPTMAENAWEKSVLEVHIPNVASIAAGTDPVKVGFLRFIRPERKFASVEELLRQITRDISSVVGR